MPKLILGILFKLDLRSLLIARLVAKGFYHLATTTFFIGAPSPLSNKSIIAFKFSEICPTIDSSTQAKLNFSQNNTIGWVVKIKDHNELSSLQTFLFDPSNKKVIDNIEVLDCKELSINRNTAGILNTLLLASFSGNQRRIPQLNGIILGNIIESCILILPDSFNHNTNLTIGHVLDGKALEIIGLANNLSTFSIGNIEKNASFKLSATLNNLSSLTMGYLQPDSTSILPKVLDSLTALTVECYNHPSLFELPCALNNLTILTIGRVNSSDNTVIKLPDSLNNLTTLTIEYIDHSGNTVIKLPDSLNNLRNLRIGCFYNKITSRTIVQLPKSLDNLTNLFIGRAFGAYPNAINLPNALNNLETFSIGNISDINLPNSLNKLTMLSIACVNSDLKLSNALHNLKTIYINKIGYKTIEITDVLANLEILNIRSIRSGGDLKLSSSLNNLTTLAITDIDGATIVLPELKNLMTLIYRKPLCCSNAKMSSIDTAKFTA